MGQIYKITNKANGKAYIGSTVSIFDKRYPRGRWWLHTHNIELQDDAFVYGKSNFDVTILEDNVAKGDIKQLEANLILLHGTLTPSGYNIECPIWKKPTEEFNAAQRYHLRKGFYDYLQYRPVPIRVGIRFFRLITGKNQEQFSKMQKVPIVTLQKIEQGKANPTIKTLNKLLRGSGLEVGIVKSDYCKEAEKKWKHILKRKTNSIK